MRTEWTIRCWGTTWWSWPPSDLPTFWVNVAAAGIVLVYVVLTFRMLKATSFGAHSTWAGSQAGLLKTILEQHTDMTLDLDRVREWWQQDPSTAIARYEAGLKAPYKPNEATKMGDSRRRVSQYFLRLRALCENALLDAHLVASTLGDEPVQVFLRYVDPLDEAVRRVGGKAHKTSERDYFRTYLRTHFPDAIAVDPWGLQQP